MEDSRHLQEIPSLFYSFPGDEPFKKCIECERNLMEDNCEYVIEKAIRNYTEYSTQDTIFDYAICMECATSINQKLSKESMLKIKQYFAENLNVENRERRIIEAAGDIMKLTNRCMIKDTEAKASGEFQIYAYCVGNKISLDNPPYMISGEVLDEVAEVISKQTRDILNGFFDSHFSPDPSLMAPLPDRPKVVLI